MWSSYGDAAGSAVKKALKPSRKRELVADLIGRYRASQRQACAAQRLSRTVFAYRSVARDAAALSLRIREITSTLVQYGYRRVHVPLRREGWQDNSHFTCNECEKQVYAFD